MTGKKLMATNTGNNELEKQLWKAADKLRKNIDAAEYKHVLLGLIFLENYYEPEQWEKYGVNLRTFDVSKVREFVGG